jgi:mRNA interferase MazF
MNGEFKRGEIYWARMDGGWGSEEAAKRPVVVVSSDRGNETCPTVMCAFTTTKFKYGVINVEIDATGVRSWIMCNQLRTLDKSRLIEYISVLNEKEIAALDNSLRIALDLNYEEDSAEIEKLESEVKKLNAQIAKLEKEKADIAVENQIKNDMYPKLYEKVLNELVAAKAAADFDKLFAAAKPEPVVEPPKAEEEPVVKAKVEINTCTAEELSRIGCNMRMVNNIIARRPYKSVDDLRSVPWVTNVGFQILKTKVTCVPVVEEKPAPTFKMKPAPNVEKATEPSPAKSKVNVNTAHWTEIKEVAGICESAAKAITGYRDKNGPYKKIEDLCVLSPRFGKRSLLKYRDKLEV